MSGSDFDRLAKQLASATSRRMVLKGALAAAIGGLFARGASQDAEATRARRACSRLGQVCGGTTPSANFTCCPGLACETGACCRPEEERCLTNDDCCGGLVCRPSGLGQQCLPPGGFGAECVEGADCASGVCDASGICTDSACIDRCDYLVEPLICGVDSRTNASCTCYPTPENICGCAAANSCLDAFDCCDSTADCGPGQRCFVPPSGSNPLLNPCGCPTAGVCMLTCDFAGDPYTAGPLSDAAIGSW